MKKDYKKIKSSLLLLGSGASGILGQTATNVSAIKGGNSEQVKRGENTTVTNTSGGLFNFLFKRGNTKKKQTVATKLKIPPCKKKILILCLKEKIATL